MAFAEEKKSLRQSTLETERDGGGIMSGAKESLESKLQVITRRRSGKALKKDTSPAEERKASPKAPLKKKKAVEKNRGRIREQESSEEDNEDMPVAVIDTGMDTVKVMRERESCSFNLLYGDRLGLLVMRLLDQCSLH